MLAVSPPSKDLEKRTIGNHMRQLARLAESVRSKGEGSSAVAKLQELNRNCALYPKDGLHLFAGEGELVGR